MTEPTVKSKHVYKAVRNYLINELGISRETAVAQVYQYIDRKVEHAIQQEGWIRRAVDRQIAELIRDGKHDKSWYTRKDLADYIMDEIKRTVREHVMGNLQVNISMETPDHEEKQ